MGARARRRGRAGTRGMETVRVAAVCAPGRARAPLMTSLWVTGSEALVVSEPEAIANELKSHWGDVFSAGP